ncbi:unnamed protein product [Orchesella dallaii]|uniref:Uncharacterized protein n=1 Tax=Orchesella dallaii TaxID=48710 RepID=A0ABP1QPK7_9HEXA
MLSAKESLDFSLVTVMCSIVVGLLLIIIFTRPLRRNDQPQNGTERVHNEPGSPALGPEEEQEKEEGKEEEQEEEKEEEKEETEPAVGPRRSRRIRHARRCPFCGDSPLLLKRLRTKSRNPNMGRK